MMGLVTGDALGNAIQFMSREEVRERGFVHDMEEGGVYETPAGTWTDDSSMALATLDSIREIGAVVPEDIMLNFVSWECHGEYTPFGEAFDEGNTCTYAIMNFMRNFYTMTGSPLLSGGSPEQIQYGYYGQIPAVGPFHVLLLCFDTNGQVVGYITVEVNYPAEG